MRGLFPGTRTPHCSAACLPTCKLVCLLCSATIPKFCSHSPACLPACSLYSCLPTCLFSLCLPYAMGSSPYYGIGMHFCTAASAFAWDTHTYAYMGPYYVCSSQDALYILPRFLGSPAFLGWDGPFHTAGSQFWVPHPPALYISINMSHKRHGVAHACSMRLHCTHCTPQQQHAHAKEDGTTLCMGSGMARTRSMKTFCSSTGFGFVLYLPGSSFIPPFLLFYHSCTLFRRILPHTLFAPYTASHLEGRTLHLIFLACMGLGLMVFSVAVNKCGMKEEKRREMALCVCGFRQFCNSTETYQYLPPFLHWGIGRIMKYEKEVLFSDQLMAVS